MLQAAASIGGGLGLAGVVVMLHGYGVFDDARIVAALAVVGTGLLIAAGQACHRFGVDWAGRVLTFLGCVAAPLNLWYWHAQGLVDVHQHLWVGATGCVALYAALLYRRAEPVYLYAVQIGVALTSFLILADINQARHLPLLSVILVVGGVVTMLANRLWPDDDTHRFARRRFDVPLWIGGHVQLAAGLAIATMLWLFDQPWAPPVRLSETFVWDSDWRWFVVVWTVAAAAYVRTAVVRKTPAWIGPAVLSAGVATYGLASPIIADEAVLIAVVSLLGCGLIIAGAVWRRTRIGFGSIADGSADTATALAAAGYALAVLTAVGQAVRGVFLFGDLSAFDVSGGAIAVQAVFTAAAAFALRREDRIGLWFAAGTLGAGWLAMVALVSSVPLERKIEVGVVLLGLRLWLPPLGRWLRRPDEPLSEEQGGQLNAGAVLLSLPLVVAGLAARGGVGPATGWDEAALVVWAVALVLVGVAIERPLQRFLGGGLLALWAVTAVVLLLMAADLSLGIWLTIGGGTLTVAAVTAGLVRQRFVSTADEGGDRPEVVGAGS